MSQNVVLEVTEEMPKYQYCIGIAECYLGYEGNLQFFQSSVANVST